MSERTAGKFLWFLKTNFPLVIDMFNVLGVNTKSAYGILEEICSTFGPRINQSQDCLDFNTEFAYGFWILLSVTLCGLVAVIFTSVVLSPRLVTDIELTFPSKSTRDEILSPEEFQIVK